MKVDAGLPEWFTNLGCVQLEIGQRLIGVAVGLDFLLAHRRKEGHDGWAANNNRRLLSDSGGQGHAEDR
jgi:hypothetical protein